MYSVFSKVSVQKLAALALCVLLSACGGGSESQNTAPVAEQAPVIPVPVPPPVGNAPVELGVMVNFGYNGLAAGAPLNVGTVQTFAVGNGTANYRFPRSGETIRGNLTIALDVADPDGIARVLVGFNGSEQALVLCSSNCGLTFSKTVTGINPRSFGLSPGSLRLELWLEDLLGNRVLFDARDIEWLPEPVIGVNTVRGATNLQVNWAPNNSARRYNVYIAEQPGFTPDNVLSKTGGRQFLALSQPGLSIPAVNPNTRYFVLITGVDSSGESLYSEEHIVQPAGAPVFSFPVAADDQFSLNEDSVLTGNLLANDSHPDGTAFRLDSAAVRPPENGTLLLNADGSFSYQPAPDFFGNDSFIYQVTDARALTAQALVTLIVLPVNDPPVLQSDNYSLKKNTTLTVITPGLLANDVDIDSATLLVDTSPVTPVSHGTLQLSADGSFSYTPVTNYAGEDFFVYQVSDGNGGLAQARVDLRIEMTNAAPVAQNDSYQLNEDERLIVDVQNGILANDSDPDGDVITLVTELVSSVSNGQLILAPDGSFQYIPNQDFFGTDSFSYQIKDPAGLVSSATVLLQVLAKNDPPVVQAASYEVGQNGLLSVAAPGLLVHAFDVDDQQLSVVTTPVVAPAKGTLTLSADGAFSYQPNADVAGTDSFSYQVKDAEGATGTGTTVINIVTKPPVMSDLNLQIPDNLSQGEIVAQLAVDSSAPGATVSFSIISGNSQGVFGLSPSGVLSIANAVALAELGDSTVVLGVKAEDSNGLSAQATVSIAILASNHAPVLQDGSFSFTEALPQGSVIGQLNWQDADTDQTHVFTILSGDSTQAFSVNAQGQLIVASSSALLALNATPVNLLVQITDSAGATDSALVALQIRSAVPVAQADTYTVDQGALLVVNSASGVLVNDSNPTTADLTVSLVSGPASGQLNLASDGSFNYQSESDFFGQDSFVYLVSNGIRAAQAVVTLNVQQVVPFLEANADSYTLNEDTLLTVGAANSLLQNDIVRSVDPVVNVILVQGPSSGSLSLNSDGTFTYQPALNVFGTFNFTYRLTQGVHSSADAQVQLNITPVNDAPSLQDATVSITDDFANLQTVLVMTVSDVDPGSYSFEILSGNTGGVFGVTPAGAIQVVNTSLLNAGSTPSYSLVVKITEDNDANLTDTATVLISVNHALLANADSYSLAEDTVLTVVPGNSVLQNDIVKASPAVSVSLVQGPPSGTLNLNTDGTFTYQPAANAFGAYHFTYRLTQGTLTSDALVELNITPVNDAPSLQNASATISTNYVNLQNVLTLSVSDVDPGSYSFDILSGNTGSVFDVTPSGVIRIANASSLTVGTYNLVASVTEDNDTSLSDTATVVIHVTGALQANADSYTLDEDTLLTVVSANSLLQNDSYSVSTAVSVSLVQGPPSGTLNLNTDGTFTYQPAANVYGTYYFTYRLTQGTLTSDALVELNITPVNDAPSLQDATATISDGYINLQHVLTLVVFDPDPGSYSFEIVSGDDDGVFSVTSDGIIKIADSALLDATTTPAYNLVVQITEDNDVALTDTAQVDITVTADSNEITKVLKDTSFALGGDLSLQTMLSGEYNKPVQILPLGDGRSLILGNISDSSDKEVFVTRLTAEGNIDSSYADQGVFRPGHKLFSSSVTEEAVAAVLSTTNELTILVNYTETAGSGFFLIRLNAEGVLDDSFGNNLGYVICESTECGGYAKATDMILNQAGHYVVSGSINGINGFLLEYDDSGVYAGLINASNGIVGFDLVRQDSQGRYYGIGTSAAGHIVVARFLSTYVFDTTDFGCNSPCVGYQEYSFSLQSSRAYDAVLYNDELYVVGSVTDGIAPSSPDALFFKLTANGSLDSAFGNAGFVRVFGHSDYPLHYQAITLSSTGFAVLTSTEETTQDLVSVSHYELDGQFALDIPFSVDGQLKAVDLHYDDTNLWVLNQFANPTYGDVDTVSFNWISKYLEATFSLDPSFSDDGRRWFNAGFGNDVLTGVRKLIFGSNVNKTLFYGYSYASTNGTYQQAYVGRLTSSGALDPSFGDHGLVLLADSELSEMEISTVLESSTGDIYVAGFGYDTNSDKIGFVSRLNLDGLVDPGFANGMFDLIPAHAGNYNGSAVTQLELTSDGHLLVGAEYNQTHDNFDIVLLQLNSDGTLDSGNFGTSASGFVVFSEIDTNSQTEERLAQMRLDPQDQSIVISGQYKLSADPRLYVARFTPDGQLMTTANSAADAFGHSGQGYSVINLVDNTNDTTKYSEYMNAITFDADSNLIFALSKSHEEDEAHYLYWLPQNGVVDHSFNSGQPRLFESFSDQTVVDLEIKAIYLDSLGRLLMAGVYDHDNVWVGRVLLDGSDPGRWDPSFEPDSTTYGAYLIDEVGPFDELMLELRGNRLTLGWLDPDNDYSATFSQYFIHEYDPNPL